MMAYLSAGENEAPGRIRFRMLEKLLQPCGPPPKLDMDEEERKLAAEQ
jgi:splicing factor 3B subunit 5